MADTGWILAGAGANDSADGDVAWSNAGNVVADSSTSASAGPVPKNGTTQHIRASNFGISLPSGAVVTGVEARVNRSTGNNAGTNFTDHTIQLLIGGARIGDNLADTLTYWPVNSSRANALYGGDDNLWGLSSVAAGDISGAGFGLSVRAIHTGDGTDAQRYAYIYTVWMRVHYEVRKSTGAFFALL